MPVRSLTSSVIKWPDARTVAAAVRRWARNIAADHPEVVRIGYFGSYARGNWGVGSDVDLIVIVSTAERPFGDRGRDWGTLDLPVPADVVVYTEEEWASMKARGRGIAAEAVNWVYGAGPGRREA